MVFNHTGVSFVSQSYHGSNLLLDRIVIAVTKYIITAITKQNRGKVMYGKGKGLKRK